MNAVSPPPAGWYPDPSGRAPFRYWDGSRWTEHTDQGTAPSPSLTSHNPPPPPPPVVAPAPPPPYAAAPPAMPLNYGTAGVPVAPTVARPAGAPWTGASFIADLKKGDGFALVVVGALLFIVLSFLPWASASLTTANGTTEDSSNGWAGDVAWLIRGWDVTEANVISQAQTGKAPDSGTDMVILLPIAVIAAGAAAASRLGKRINKVNEVVLGASGLLAVLTIAEVVHVNGAVDDLQKIAAKYGTALSGSVDIGLYLAVVAALVMTAGALRTFMAGRHPVA